MTDESYAQIIDNFPTSSNFNEGYQHKRDEVVAMLKSFTLTEPFCVEDFSLDSVAEVSDILTQKGFYVVGVYEKDKLHFLDVRRQRIGF